MKIARRKSKVIKIGDVAIGGDNPIAIQSMTKTETSDIPKTVSQIKELQAAGCEIVRVAVKDNRDALSLKRIKKEVAIPIVADIHFSWRLALLAIESGADKIRLNPGNIYKKQEVKEVVRAAKAHHIPIRVGVNSGSIRGDKLQVASYKLGGRGIADKMVRSALDYIKILEGCGFYEIVVSLKSSDIFDTIEAYRKISQRCSYPLHLGVTATGSAYSGAIKSAIALSSLLLEGIGDTIRVSLTDQPKAEVRIARAILESLGLRSFGPQIISCPTCGRCEVNLLGIVKELDKKLSALNSELLTKPLTLAVMGCLVNGPGEAKEADMGVAFGKKEGLFFKNGKVVRKVSPDKCVDILLTQVYKFSPSTPLRADGERSRTIRNN